MRSFALTLLLALSGTAWGQATDVDCDKCVDTSDIAKNAVTSDKFRAGTIVTADFAAESIKNSRVADGTLTGSDLAANTLDGDQIRDGTLTNIDLKWNTLAGNRIQDGSITSAKFKDGSITAAKLATNAVFENTIVISADPQDAVGNCTALRDTLAMFAANNPVHTLIKLAPGTYDCSNGGAGSGIVVKPNIDIEGSGQGSTRILGDAQADGHAVVSLLGPVELRHLTIDNTRVDDQKPHAVYAPAQGRLSFVTLITHDDAGAAEPIDCGISNMQSPSLVVRNSRISNAAGDQAAFRCPNNVYASSQIESDSVGPGEHHCIASFDDSFQPFEHDCTPPP